MTRLNKAELAAIQEAISTTPKSRTRITPRLKEVLEKNMKLSDLLDDLKPIMKSNPSPTFEGGKMQTIKDAPEERRKEKEAAILKRAKAKMGMKEGGLAEATAKLKAKGMKEGGMVVKDKVVSIDKSPNSGLITVKGFGAGRRT